MMKLTDKQFIYLVGAASDATVGAITGNNPTGRRIANRRYYGC